MRQLPFFVLAQPRMAENRGGGQKTAGTPAAEQ